MEEYEEALTECNNSDKKILQFIWHKVLGHSS